MARKKERLPREDLVTISSDWDRVVPLDEGRRLVPRRFLATIFHGHYAVELEVEVDDRGAGTCRSVRIWPIERLAESVSGEELDRLSFDELVRRAVAHAAMRSTAVARGPSGNPSHLLTNAEGDDFYRQLTKGARRPRKGSPVTDSNLQTVADVYRMAVERGDPPTKTVANQLHIARSTAGRWVQKARERGFLGKAKARTAGEAS
jgi:hypothetical protein